MEINIGDKLINDEHADIIYVLGTGLSLDCFLKSDEWHSGINRDNAIIISINAAMSIVKPSIQICGDTWGIDYWSKHRNNDHRVQWVSRPSTAATHYIENGCNYVDCHALFEEPFRGVSVIAMQTAYYIWYHGKIKQIYYAGLDCSEFVIDGKNYRTALSIEPMRNQQNEQPPPNWRYSDYRRVRSDVKSYNTQLKGLAMFKYQEDFCEILKCRSIIDLTKLDTRQPHVGYAMATKDNYYGL